MEIMPLGDSALIVRMTESAKALDEVLAARAKIEAARIPGVIECTSAYATLGVFFDPMEVVRGGAAPDAITAWMSERIRQALRQRGRRGFAKSRLHEVPVCFDAEFGPDLERVAGTAKLSTDDVIKLYCAAHYRVVCIGFTPGFPYLSGLPAKLATPRHAIPRKEVASGTVAIGGEHTGIYPFASPGGWNLIGRTSLRLFNASNEPPALLQPGDRVRFRAVDRGEFETLQT